MNEKDSIEKDVTPYANNTTDDKPVTFNDFIMKVISIFTKNNTEFTQHDFEFFEKMYQNNTDVDSALCIYKETTTTFADSKIPDINKDEKHKVDNRLVTDYNNINEITNEIDHDIDYNALGFSAISLQSDGSSPNGNVNPNDNGTEIGRDTERYHLPAHMMIIPIRYFESVRDIINFARLSKSYNQVIEMLKYNNITDTDPDLFANMQTQHFYTREEYNMYKKDNMYQYIIWFPVKNNEIAKYDDRHVFKAVEYTPDDRVIYDDFIFFTVPDYVRALSERAFSNATLDTVNLSHVKYLGERCFEGALIQDIFIPEGVRVIPKECFNECKKLTSVTLPSTLRCIGQSAFAKCNLLETIDIPDGVTEIGCYCFLGCFSLSSVHLPIQLTTLQSACFEGTELEEVVIPPNVGTLESTALSTDTLRKVSIPNSVIIIASDLFLNCVALEVIEAPAHLINKLMSMYMYDVMVIYDTTNKVIYVRDIADTMRFITMDELMAKDSIDIEQTLLYIVEKVHDIKYVDKYVPVHGVRDIMENFD